MQMLKETKMKKNIKESSAFSFSPDEPSQLVNGSYNISKVDDPIELKRLNNYISSVFSVGVPFQSVKDTMNQLRLKLNLIGYDIDASLFLRKEHGEINATLPLKRFGGITGIDDQGKKLDNPHGPGPKFNIVISGTSDFITAKVIPASNTGVEANAQPLPAETTPEEPKPVKEGFSISNILKFIRRK
jgi:hypothetical protein